MSKASQIRSLLAQGGKTTRQIACIVFSTEKPTAANLAYVRVSGRQRGDGAMSKHDIAYAIKIAGSLKAFYDAQNQKTKERRAAYWKARWRDDPSYRAYKLNWQRRSRAKKALTAAPNQVSA
jgi:hypothetical protein